MKQALTKLVAGALVVGVLGAFALLVKGGPLVARALHSGAGPAPAAAQADQAAGVAANAQGIQVIERDNDDAAATDDDEADGEEDCAHAFNIRVDGVGGPGEAMFYSATGAAPFDVLTEAPAQASGAKPDLQTLELVDSTGVLVAGVVKDSAAAKAGLRRGDIILSVDGQALGDTPILDGLDSIAGKKAGDSVALKVKRGDAELTLALTLPASTIDGQAHGFIGLLPALGAGGPARMMLRRAIGPIGQIMDVVPNTPAAEAGLKAGERIVSVDGQKPAAGKGIVELIGAHKPGDTVTLEIAAQDAKDDAARKVTVTLAENPDKKGSAYLGVKVGAAVDIKMMHSGGLMPHLRQWFQHHWGGQDAAPAAPGKLAPAPAAPSVRPQVPPAPGGSSM